jgi:predicted ATPase
MADKAESASPPRAAASTASAGQRLKLQTSLGQAMMWSRGYGSDESKTAFARVRTLATGVADASERFDAYYGLFVGSLMRGELRLARETAESFLREAENEGRMTEAAAARRNVGQARLWQGDFVDARTDFAEALRTYDPERDRDAKFRFGADTGAAAAGFLALASWALGDVKQARALSEEALARADETAHAPTRANVYYVISRYHMLRGDPETVMRTAKIPLDLGREHGMALYLAYGEMDSNWARAWLGDRQSGTIGLREALAAYRGQGNKVHVPLFQGRLAELEAKGREVDDASRRIDEALALANETGERWVDALLHRIRGAILLKRDPPNTEHAEEAFLAAVAIAQAQKARSFELQAALALAKLFQSTARPAEAHAMLAPALEGFAPTPEMPEIAEAQALLVVLAEADEVKAEVERRRRRQHLQVSYGNALISARGFGAAETTEAFARARDAAYGEKDAPERLAADFGLWAGSYTRGELTSMRAHAAAFLADVAGKPEMAEAGIAYRCQGITYWFAGEYLEARDHLERALASFQPGRDDELAYRFGHDPGVPAMAYLALVLWSLGEVDNALPLVERMRERIGSLSHANTLALGTMHASMFELMRGDRLRLRTCALELVRIVREHDLRLFRAFGEFLEGWAAADVGALADGLAGMRRGAESLREQNALVFDGLIKIALSETEARAGDLERAIAALDEALATVERTGYRAFEAELRRARGEMLLRRDPADFAEAEQALQTAVAIARQQGTRAFELRAALSLAKLYQSTNRPVEAHAVLAPALEGFSPTPEMPEIAEAQSLLVALAETEEVKAPEAQRQRRLHLQTAYGQAMMWAKGFSTEETKAALSRATELTAQTDSFADRFAASHLKWTCAILRGELRSARELETSFLKEAEDTGRLVETGVARRGLALACYQAADFLEARTHCERGLEACNPENERETQERLQDATGPLVMSVLAVTMWQLGEVDRARELIEQVTRHASDLGHPPSMAHPLLWKSHLEILRGDPAAALIAAEALEGLGQEHGLPFGRTWAELSVGWARGRLHDAATGAEDLRRVLAHRIEQGALSDAWFYKGLLAELEAETLGAEPALARIDEAIALARQVETRCNLPFLHLLRGKLLLRRNPSNPAPAEEAFQSALAIAKQQGARSWGLRGSLSLARLYQSTARPLDAHAVLAPALEGFTPTPEMPEIADAQELLSGLAEKHEVKTVIAQRQRRLDLQKSYGQALMWGKGFAAEETRAAFARVDEFAGPAENAAARFAAADAQSLSNFVRGELRHARETAETFLREAEAEGRGMEAGAARRMLGLVCLYQGDLKAARSVFEPVLADYLPERDGKTQFLFGRDTEVAAAASLALAEWHLGEVERARHLIDRATRRADELGQAATIANALFWKTYLECRRDDVTATRLAADALLVVTKEYGIKTRKLDGRALDRRVQCAPGPTKASAADAGDRRLDPRLLRGVEVLQAAALKSIEAPLVDGDALSPNAMDRAPIAELQAVAATPLSGRSRDRDALPFGASRGHGREPSRDVRGIARGERLAEEGWLAGAGH